MKVTAALPSGVSALFFEPARRRRALEAKLAERFASRGYSEVILPILDYLEPYEPLLSARGRSELYRFIDRDGEQLALRADFTPMLARLIAPRLAALELPLRFFYRGDVVRYSEERPGRQRESHQMGAELLGLGGDAADHEVFALFLEQLVDSGIGGVRVVVGFAGALDEIALAAAGDGAAQLLEAVARRDRSHLRRQAGEAAELLLEVVEQGVPADPGRLGPNGAATLARLGALAKTAAGQAIDVQVDLAEFAAFSTTSRLAKASPERAYYDGLLFRAYAGAGAAPIGGGGRYDGLFRLLGAEVPAVGFSLAIDRWMDAAPDERRIEGDER